MNLIDEAFEMDRQRQHSSVVALQLESRRVAAALEG